MTLAQAALVSLGRGTQRLRDLHVEIGSSLEIVYKLPSLSGRLMWQRRASLVQYYHSKSSQKTMWYHRVFPRAMKPSMAQIQSLQQIITSWNYLIMVLYGIWSSSARETRYTLTINANSTNKANFLEIEVMIVIPWPFIWHILIVVVLMSTHRTFWCL